MSMLIPGMLVINEDHTHIGIYVGELIDSDGTFYKHCVIDCTLKKKGGQIIKNGIYANEIENTNFKFYCSFNYIDYYK